MVTLMTTRCCTRAISAREDRVMEEEIVASR